MSEEFATIRDILKDFIGCSLVDVTQHDFEDYEREGKAFIYLHFSNGRTMYVEIKAGDDPTFCYDAPDEEE